MTTFVVRLCDLSAEILRNTKAEMQRFDWHEDEIDYFKDIPIVHIVVDEDNLTVDDKWMSVEEESEV